MGRLSCSASGSPRTRSRPGRTLSRPPTRRALPLPLMDRRRVATAPPLPSALHLTPSTPALPSIPAAVSITLIHRDNPPQSSSAGVPPRERRPLHGPLRAQHGRSAALLHRGAALVLPSEGPQDRPRVRGHGGALLRCWCWAWGVGCGGGGHLTPRRVTKRRCLYLRGVVESGGSRAVRVSQRTTPVDLPLSGPFSRCPARRAACPGRTTWTIWTSVSA